MKRILVGILAGFSLFSLLRAAEAPPASGYEQLKAEAEKFYAEKSFSLANEKYAAAKKLKLSKDEARWVDFRLADSQWRAGAVSKQIADDKVEEARQQLDKMVRDIKRPEEKDLVWAEIQESLADSHWMRQRGANWGMAWPFYQQALDWWAGAADLEAARARYLAMVWKMAKPAWAEPYYVYGNYGNVLPPDVVENALKIAQTEEDKAHAHYLAAMTLRQHGWNANDNRVPDEFAAALKIGKKTDWYDDALFNYAQWMESQGRVVTNKDDSVTRKQDFVTAVKLYRQLLDEFKQGESRYWQQAKNQIKQITGEQLGVHVGNYFLPDSEIQFGVNWRNVKRIEMSIYAIDLTKDVALTDPDLNYIQQISVAGKEKVRTLEKVTNDTGEHIPGNDMIHLGAKLEPGAYLLEAVASGEKSRELILVTDAALAIKTAGKQAIVWFANAENGAPIANGSITLWERFHSGSKYVWRSQAKETGTNGLAVFELTGEVNRDQLLATAKLANRQTLSFGHSWWNRTGDQLQWKIYAFTDRTAYRPGDKVNWKFFARTYQHGQYANASGRTIEWEIHDPQGAKIKQGKSPLNSFGSAWGDVDLTDKMPLGSYQVQFWDEGRKNGIGNAELFRLEEYKLPEFKVAVKTPEEEGRRKSFLLGEKVEVEIQSDYYFGGPVANANVEVIVRQNNYYRWWHQPWDFPWFYRDFNPYQHHWRGGGGELKRETLKTDATGKAKMTFDTPQGGGQDMEYTIEARVTDASRREIVGNGSVKVTRQRYYVEPRPEHNLYGPRDKVTINVKAMDPNDQPVSVEGTVKVMRQTWVEKWIAPDGRIVSGPERRAMLARSSNAWKAGGTRVPMSGSWKQKFAGYESEEILLRQLKTATNGEAQFTFTPGREGYFVVTWNSPQRGGSPVSAQCSVWATTEKTSELGYNRQGGVEIIVDKDTFRAGENAAVMLVSPVSDRWVLFSVEGDDLYNVDVVHLDGTVKFVQLPLEEKHVPNIFLTASSFSDGEFSTDQKQVVVPPLKNFLNISVAADTKDYQPRDEATFTVTATDHLGKPAKTEIALAVADESVLYIQEDIAGDPREFYFGTKRSQQVQTQTTMSQKQLIRLVEVETNQFVDERYAGQILGVLDESEVTVSGGVLREERKASLSRFGGGAGRARGLGGAMNFAMEANGMVAMDAAMPMAAAMPASAPVGLAMAKAMPQRRQMEKKERADKDGAAESERGGSGEPNVVVRSDFRATAFWQPDVVTDAKGKATVKVKLPDSLTTWRATARAVSEGNQFGISNASVVTRMPLIVRLQAPRFFVVGDAVVVSAVINNNTDKPLEVKNRLEADGLVISGIGMKDGMVIKGQRAESISVPANGEARVDWAVFAKDAGAAKLKVTGVSGKLADAMEKTYVVHEHGIEKFIGKSGKVRGDAATLKFDLPKERKAGSTTLNVSVAPSIAVTMLDALPYLADYPYGCTEQTMSRFLPAVIVAKTLKDLGLKPEAVADKIFGGIEASNLTNKQFMSRQHYSSNNLAKLDDMVKAGLDRLYDFQHGDGGWGWWKEGESDAYMTAYVVWGLSLARDAGRDIRGGVIERGLDFLDKKLVEFENDPAMQAWMLHAMSAGKRSTKFTAKAMENLWGKREELNAYTRSLFLLATVRYGDPNKTAAILARNLRDGVKKDDKPDVSIVQEGVQQSQAAVMGTAHWGEDGLWWRWSDGGIEATAFALKATLAADPKSDLIEPVMNWLVKGRRGAQWSNTRDTAICILALCDYLKVSEELAPELEYELSVNGAKVATKKITAEEALSAPSTFAIDTKLIRDGVNEVRVVRKGGKGALYVSAHAQFFSLEEPITPAGNEIFVRRQYYKIVGRPTLLKGYVYDRAPLNDGDSIASGDRVETVVTIEAKNNYEYLVFEDLKPAGFEAVEIKSGQSLHAQELKTGSIKTHLNTAAAIQSQIADLKSQMDYTGRTRWVYQELRDRKVAMFVDKLPEGLWEIRYDLRAEVPGSFHALPVLGHAMYVPEIRCNGTEIRVTVEERKDK